MRPQIALPRPLALALWGAAGIGFYVASGYNYLLFHVLAEGFSIVVAAGVFMIVWNTRRFLEDDYLLFVGTAYLFVAGLDAVHTLAYRGMGILGGDEANTATQLWIAARFLQSASLLVAPWYTRRRVQLEAVLAAYIAIVTLLLLAIFVWRVFPDCFVVGRGLTPFKKISEYVISGILLAAIALLIRQRDRFDRTVLTWVLTSIGLTILSELAFTYYVSVYGLSNFLGHLGKIVAFLLIYKALIETGLSRPYEVLFRTLQQREATLRAQQGQLQLFVEHAPAAIAMLDRSMGYLMASERWLADYGLAGRDLRGRSHYDIFPEIPERWKAIHRRCLAGAVERADEDPFIRADGTTQWVRWEVRPWYAAPDTVGGLLIFSEDITVRKQADEALRRAKDELEQQVQARTEALSRAVATLQVQGGQLRALASELTLAEQRERRRLAELLHDGLQQLVVAARLRAHMLAQSSEAAIRRGCTEIVSLLQEALREARTLTGELNPPMLQRGDLRAALEWLSRSMLDRHRLRVHLDIPDTPPILAEDVAVLLYQSVRELLFNTAKHARAPGAEVTFADHAEAVQLTVADAGVGFDPTRLRVTGGAAGGFGLLSIRERLEVLGGRLEITSAPGEGSRFTLWVPLRSKATGTAAPAAPPPSPVVPGHA